MRALLSIALAILCTSAFAAVTVSQRYRSERNSEREVRKSTELIVLHTTEAHAKSALRHTSERGLCHYCVTEDGSIYQIIDRDKVAFHAGLSMWNKKEEIDNISIGIECVGYHNKVMPRKQLNAIRDLVSELQDIYGIPDDRVVTHSQVAYGNKNKWQKHKHRGRKRCGMLFAMPSVRTVLKLNTRAAFDPDVKAKRLVVADAYLNRALYGREDTMKSTYGKGSVKGVDPTKSKLIAKKKVVQKKTGNTKPVNKNTKVTKSTNTTKKQNNTSSKKFVSVPQSIPELKAQGFKVVGTVTKNKKLSEIVGNKWNAPDTYYTINSTVLPGNMLRDGRLKEGMTIWRKK